MARGANAGAVRVDIIADSAQFVKGFRSSEERMKKFRKDALAMVRRVRTAFKAMAVSVAAVGTALGVGVKNMVSYSSKVVEVSKNVGITTRTLENFRAVMAGDGLGVEKADQALQAFNRRIGQARMGTGEAKKSLEALNISLTTASGQYKTNDELLKEVAVKLRELDNEQLAAAHSANLFSDVGKQMVGTLVSLGGSYDDLMQRMGRFNTLSRTQHEANKSLGQAFEDWRKSAADLVNRLLANLAPALTKVFDRWTAWMQEVKESPKWMAEVTNVTLGLVQRIEAMVSALGWVLSAVNVVSRFAMSLGVISDFAIDNYANPYKLAQRMYEPDSLRYMEIDVEKYAFLVSKTAGIIAEAKKQFDENAKNPAGMMQQVEGSFFDTAIYKDNIGVLETYATALELAVKRLEEFKEKNKQVVKSLDDEEAAIPFQGAVGLTDNVKAMRTRGGHSWNRYQKPTTLDPLVVTPGRDLFSDYRAIANERRNAFADSYGMSDLGYRRHRMGALGHERRTAFADSIGNDVKIGINRAMAAVAHERRNAFADSIGNDVVAGFKVGMRAVARERRNAFVDSIGNDVKIAIDHSMRAVAHERRTAFADSIGNDVKIGIDESMRAVASERRRAFADSIGNDVKRGIDRAMMAVAAERRRAFADSIGNDVVGTGPWAAFWRREAEDYKNRAGLYGGRIYGDATDWQDMSTNLKFAEDMRKEQDRVRQGNAELRASFDTLGDSIVDNFRNAGEALKQFARDLVKIGWQRLVLNPVGTALFGAADGEGDGGLLGGLFNSAFPPGAGASASASSIDFGGIGASASASLGGGRGVTIVNNIKSTDGPGVRAALAKATPGIVNAAQAQISDNASRFGTTRQMIRGAA